MLGACFENNLISLNNVALLWSGPVPASCTVHGSPTCVVVAETTVPIGFKGQWGTRMRPPAVSSPFQCWHSHMFTPPASGPPRAPRVLGAVFAPSCSQPFFCCCYFDAGSRLGTPFNDRAPWKRRQGNHTDRTQTPRSGKPTSHHRGYHNALYTPTILSPTPGK